VYVSEDFDNVLVSSQGTQAVELCSNKIRLFLTGCWVLYNSHKVIVYNELCKFRVNKTNCDQKLELISSLVCY